MCRFIKGKYVPLITCEYRNPKEYGQYLICHLLQYSILLILLLLLEIGLGILTFILKDKGWIKNQATYGLRNFILHYREDVRNLNILRWCIILLLACIPTKNSSSFFSRISKISSTTYSSSGNAVESIIRQIGMPIVILTARQAY